MMPRKSGRKSKTKVKYSSRFLGALAVFFFSAITPARPQQSGLKCDGQWRTTHAVDLNTQYGDFNSLNAVTALSSADAWAVGVTRRFAGKDYSKTLIEHWDGTSWTPVQLPQPRLPIALLFGVSALSSDDVWAVGYEQNLRSGYRTLIEHWDGNAWSIVQDGTEQGYLTSVVAIAPNDVWAVGSTDYVGYGLIEHWDGTSWTRTLAFNAIFFRAITALNNHDVWAVGNQSTSAEGDNTYAAHFDGVSWSVVPTPSPLQKHLSDQNWLTSVSALAANDVWAVGVTRNSDFGIRDRTLTMHWDGNTWTVVPSPRQGTDVDNDFWSVVAFDSNNVWAVGAVGVDPDFTPLIEHWNGTAWKPVPASSPRGVLLSLAGVAANMELLSTGYRNKQASYTGTLVQYLCTGQ